MFVYYRFDIVGYGCMTCIGNSGPLPEPVSQAIEKGMSDFKAAFILANFVRHFA